MRYEYMQETFVNQSPAAVLEPLLDKHSQAGWEFVQVIGPFSHPTKSYVGGGESLVSGTAYMAVFRRTVTETDGQPWLNK